MKVMDWILSILSFGFYYCFRIHEKKFERSAMILTNKRLISLDIRQRAGMVPEHLSEVFVGLRSFFPGEIKGGYLNSHNRKHLHAGLECDAGHLYLDFPVSGRKALPFAKSLMMTVSRADAQTKIEYKDICDSPVLDKTDMQGLPLLKNEIPIDVIQGGRHAENYNPFCLIPTTPPQYL